ITDNGTLNVNSAAAVVVQDFGASDGIVVNGTMSASSTSFTRSSSSGGSVLQVNANGHLTATGCTFAWATLTLNSTSMDSIRASILATQLAVNSGASITITG